ncbi:hypothetical protein STEG23_015126 [Scotinomys teguina]
MKWNYSSDRPLGDEERGEGMLGSMGQACADSIQHSTVITVEKCLSSAILETPELRTQVLLYLRKASNECRCDDFNRR